MDIVKKLVKIKWQFFFSFVFLVRLYIEERGNREIFLWFLDGKKCSHANGDGEEKRGELRRRNDITITLMKLSFPSLKILKKNEREKFCGGKNFTDQWRVS